MADDKIKTKELVKKLAEISGKNQGDVHDVLKAMPEAVISFLKEEKTVPLNGLGSFRPSMVKENPRAWNPTEKSYYTRPAYMNVTFKKSSSLKKALNGDEETPEADTEE